MGLRPIRCLHLFLIVNTKLMNLLNRSFAPIRLVRSTQAHARIHMQKRLFSEVMDEGTFHSIADEFLENLETDLTTLESLLETNDFDLDNSQGVLTLHLGSMGSWVINKQTPNRQIWWSSPVSGPLRFNYCFPNTTWINTRDNSTRITDLLEEEISSRANLPFSLSATRQLTN